MKGAHWLLLGVLLLIVTFVGARWVFPPSSASGGRNNTDSPGGADQNPKQVVCWGFFENENGVANRTPRQFGDIIDVMPENSVVKKGDVLLQLDDELAKLKVKEAKADVKAGEQQFAEAKQLTNFYDLQKKQQKSAIASVDLEIKEKERERDVKLFYLKENEPIKNTVKELYEFALGHLQEKKKAEEAKLKQLELQDAKLKIKQAEADLAAKQSRLEQAEEALKHFQIVADGPGKVLRTFVHKGETLGPTPRMNPALEFMPVGRMIVRAEVLQEWGRFVQKDQAVTIEDDVYKGITWQGTVKSVADVYAPIRSPVIEPFRYNDVRTLEIIIDVKDADNAKHSQRVRAKVTIQ